MKVLSKDHLYELENFDKPETPGQRLQFIEKEPVTPGATELRTVNDGTTNEDVIRVLVDRLNGLQSKFPCRENAIATTHLETALLWLEKRTRDRKARGVEGSHQK